MRRHPTHTTSSSALAASTRRLNRLILAIFVLFLVNVLAMAVFSGAFGRLASSSSSSEGSILDVRQKYGSVLFPRRHSVSASVTVLPEVGEKTSAESTIRVDENENFSREHDCKREWSCASSDCDTYFCYETTQRWTERASKTNEVKNVFKELWWKPKFKEAALVDYTRSIVLVLQRTHVLIGFLASTEPDASSSEKWEERKSREAKDVAAETETMLYPRGRWRDDVNRGMIPPRLEHPDDPLGKSTVVVLISAYKDQLCANTLRELFEHASNPERVTVGLVLQSDDTDGAHGENCLEKYCKRVGEANCRRDRITQLRRPLDYSRGVMPARYLQQTLIKDEEFCLQIDSHMVFPPRWDEIAIKDWLGANNEMAVMTTYPNRVVDRENQNYSPARCNTVWGHNVVAGGTSAHNIKHPGAPILVAFFGAGIAFSKCHANLVVPYDPYMSFLFKGEEFNRSARLWTHGYDLYAPRKNYAYHYYDDDPKPKEELQQPRDRSFFGGYHSGELLSQSEYRWQAIFGMLDPPPPTSPKDSDRSARLQAAHRHRTNLKPRMMVDLDLFGLGDRRSLKEYEIFSGVNLLKHTAQDMCGRLGKMEWVPWTIPENFAPLGLGCRDIPATCCNHGLRQMDVNAEAFNLKLDNHVWADKVLGDEGGVIATTSVGVDDSTRPADRGVFDAEYLKKAAQSAMTLIQSGEPIVSPAWYRATKTC